MELDHRDNTRKISVQNTPQETKHDYSFACDRVHNKMIKKNESFYFKTGSDTGIYIINNNNNILLRSSINGRAHRSKIKLTLVEGVFDDVSS